MKSRNIYPKYYVPGIISLIGIFFLLLFFFNKYEKENSFGILRIVLPSDKQGKLFSIHNLNVPVRKYEYINLGVPNESYLEKIYKIDTLTANIQSSYDTTHGVFIHFEPEAKYASFIKVLDTFEKNELRIFLWIGNSLFFFNKDGPPSDYTELPIVSMCGTYTTSVSQKYDWKEWFQLDFSQSYPLLTGFFLFATVTIWYIKK